MSGYVIRPLGADDRDWVRQFVTARWGAETVVAHGAVYRPHELPRYAAVREGQPAGLLTYHAEADGCEIVTLDSVPPAIGIGSTQAQARDTARRRRRDPAAQ